MRRRDASAMRTAGAAAAGFSLVELLVSLAVFSLAMASLAGMLLHNSRISKSQQMTAEAQATARNSLAIIVQELRSAGWDPLNAGLAAVALDPDLTDPISEIEIFADLNEDGDADDTDEAVLIRHIDRRIEWRRTTGDPFTTLAVNVSNDADGDGTPEPMFVPDSTTSPTRITIRITAEAPVADLTTGQVARYTVTSEVALRNTL